MRNIMNQPQNEITFALRLMLLIPSLPIELLNAKWCDIELNKYQWIVKRAQQKPAIQGWTLPLIAELSTAAHQCLVELHSFQGGMQECLFPNLCTMKKAERDKQINQAIQANWGHYQVDVNSFRDFIKAMAHENSPFESKFIDQAIANKCKSHQDSQSYRFCKNAVAEWLSIELFTQVSQPIPSGRF
jgi:hypothetical protein